MDSLPVMLVSPALSADPVHGFSPNRPPLRSTPDRDAAQSPVIGPGLFSAGFELDQEFGLDNGGRRA